MSNMFTGSDLALFLSNDTQKDEVDSKDLQLAKPTFDSSKKVKRYFTGKIPLWIDDSLKSEDSIQSQAHAIDSSKIVKGEVVDRRLARLAEATSKSTQNIDNTRRRRIYEAEIVVDNSNVSAVTDEPVSNNCDKSIKEGKYQVIASKQHSDENDEDGIASRRARAIEKMADRRRIESCNESKEQAESVSEEEEDEEEYASEFSDEEDEEEQEKPVIKFVPKNKRDTLKDAEVLMMEEEEKEKLKRLEIEARKQQSRLLVAESMKRMDESRDEDVTDAESDAGLPDDNDDLIDEEVALDMWKIREMMRLKRDCDERNQMALKTSDFNRRRNMTDEERLKEDNELEASTNKNSDGTKNQSKYLQKYYHKGVFYMDEDTLNKSENDVRSRDYNLPTGDDTFDKAALPAVMQVKRFGMKGRTKYTSLSDQDTTRDNKNIKGSTSSSDYNGSNSSTNLSDRSNLPSKLSIHDSFNKKRNAFSDDLDSAGRKKKKAML